MRHDFLGAQGIDLVGVHLAETTPAPTQAPKRNRMILRALIEYLTLAALVYGACLTF